MNHPTEQQWLATILNGEDLRRALVITNFPFQNSAFRGAFVQEGKVQRHAGLDATLIDNIIPLFFKYSKHGCGEKEFYDAVYSFVDSWENQRNLQLTSITDSSTWAKMAIKNYPLVKDCKTIDELPKETVAINIVASGSSLDKSVSTIDKSLTTIACNSSIRKLNNAGIAPKYVVSADYRDAAYSGIEGCNKGNTMLLCPTTCNNKVLEAFHPNVAIWTGRSKINNKLLGLKECIIEEEGTVSISMLDIAKHLGETEVHIYGLDCCYLENGQYGNSLAHEEGRMRTIDGLPTVLCNDASFRPTDNTLLAYKESIERFVEANPAIKFFNHSTTGAKIKGMIYA